MKDPLYADMVNLLHEEFRSYDDGEGIDGDVAEAIYWFGAHWHGGQSSNLYSAMSALCGFSPGPIATGPKMGPRYNGSVDDLEDDGTLANLMYYFLEDYYCGD
jgi:hypothetical protein